MKALALTGWVPDLEKWGKPHYRAIADAIAADIRTGRLAPADRLPPQRDLAKRLAIDFTTVARGYVEAQRRGLVESRVGQGTFVRPSAPKVETNASRRPALVDFTMNLPPEPDNPDLLAKMRQAMIEASADLTGLLRYQGFGGALEDREAGVLWLSRRGLLVPSEQVMICPGAHSALLAVMGLVARPGDAIVSEELTYPGARAISAHLGLRLIGLPMDDDGLDPDAFAAACQRHAPKALYLNPTLQNPTTATIPRARREAIIAAAERHGVFIIEDDAYGILPPQGPPAFYALAPKITYYIAGLAKYLGAGLRLAYALAPSPRAALALSPILRAATVMASPITAAIASRWIREGTADEILAAIRNESIARQVLAKEILPPGSYAAHPGGFHLWMSLPQSWNRSSFAARVRSAGIGVVTSDAFAVTEKVPQAVRICLGGIANRAEVRHALEVMADAHGQSPALASEFI